MRVQFRVCSFEERERKKLKKFGIEFTVREPEVGYMTVDVAKRTVVESGLKSLDALYLTTAVYSQDEIDAAHWFTLHSDYVKGNTAPVDAIPFGEAYFESICEVCGITGRQTADLGIKRLKVKPRNVTQLMNRGGFYFVTRKDYEDVFQDFGVGMRPTLKSSEEKGDLFAVQLTAEDQIANFSDVSRYTVARICDSCGRTKYVYDDSLPFPSVSVPEGCHMAMSDAIFGEGWAAFRAMVVSKELRNALLQARFKNLVFHVIGWDGQDG